MPVTFETFGLVWSVPPASEDTARFDHSNMRSGPLVRPATDWRTTRNWTLPCQPSSVSSESSSAPVMATFLRPTVPPKISMPSSPELWTWTWSIVVPEPTPPSVRPLRSSPAAAEVMNAPG